MSHTFSQLLIHIVFSTKHRDPLIEPEHRDALYFQVTQMVVQEGCSLLAIGGMPDHIHLLIRLKPSVSVSLLVRVLKANSSRWAHDRPGLGPGFAWQEGYGAFSVSESAARTVCRYIENQETHHRQRSFDDEWSGFLKKHQLEAFGTMRAESAADNGVVVNRSPT